MGTNPPAAGHSLAPEHRATAQQVAGGIAPLARVQAAIGVFGGLVGAVGLLLPHPDQYLVVGLAATQVSSVGLGILLFVYAGRIPIWILSALPLLATLMVSGTVAFSADATGPYALFYLWPGIYSFFFLSRREASLQIAFTTLNYVAVAFLVGAPAAGADPAVAHYLFVAIATLAGGGLLQVYMRGRIESLVRRLAETAMTDLHTGLPNARGTNELLAAEVARVEASGHPLSVLVGDIDHFKRVNEKVGHERGDQILRELADLLHSSIRPVDYVGRSGPAEFTVVLPGSDGGDAASFASDLLGVIRRRFASIPGGFTLSFGSATHPGDGSSAGALLSAAGKAMYAAKVFGRDRVVSYSSQVEAMMQRIDGKHAQDKGELAAVLSLADALDLREDSTARHSEVVGGLCEEIAKELGLPRERVERVRLAGILHDIGKIAIPDAVLCKPGPLTDSEFELMRRHPEIGAGMLAASELSDVREWVLAHHERPDGAGYPRGLDDEAIPVEAKILSVSDAYEAMTADRVYRKAPGHDFAMRELRRGAGEQFDGRVVLALEAVIERRREVSRSQDPLESFRRAAEASHPLGAAPASAS